MYPHAVYCKSYLENVDERLSEIVKVVARHIGALKEKVLFEKCTCECMGYIVQKEKGHTRAAGVKKRNCPPKYCMKTTERTVSVAVTKMSTLRIAQSERKALSYYASKRKGHSQWAGRMGERSRGDAKRTASLRKKPNAAMRRMQRATWKKVRYT